MSAGCTIIWKTILEPLGSATEKQATGTQVVILDELDEQLANQTWCEEHHRGSLLPCHSL